MKERKEQYDLQNRLINFAARVMNVVEAMPNNRIGNHVAGQLVRSGTLHRIMAKLKAQNHVETLSTR